jgi:hypothetical protein
MVPRAISRLLAAGFLSPLLLVLSAVSPLRAELNLSPHVEHSDLDGVKIAHLAFENGTAQKTTYQPPTNWVYSGSANQLQLQPPEKTQVEIAIAKIQAKDAISFDEANREKLKQKAIASLPEGSTEIKLEGEEPNPLRISGRDTYLLQFSYTHFGERFRRYILLLGLASGQLQFQLTSRERDYDELVKAFQRSLYSWQHLT